MATLKIFIIIEGILNRFIDVKKTKIEAENLIKELQTNNLDMFGKKLQYRIFEKEI